MNKSLFLGIGILLVIGAIVIFGRGSSKNKNGNPFSLKKEVSVGIDVCAEFPREWVGSVINKDVIKTETHNSNSANVCEYYVDENSFVTLRLNNLNFETQKKGQVSLGRTTTVNSQISLNNFVAVQENGLINDVVLEINPNQILTVDRSSTKDLDETAIIEFASKVADRIKSGENQGSSSNPTIEPTQKSESNGGGVPLPLDTDIINSFFGQISLKRPSDAVTMMASSITNNDSIKQAWAVQFNAFNSLNVISVEPSMKDEWTQTKHTYKVILDVTMNPNSGGEAIPYFGWENGQNTRWINLVKEDKMWRVEGIATGP
jgi:hypothetical protein